MNPQTWKPLFRKVTVYYALLSLLIVAIAVVHPEFLKVMPFGGLDHWKNDPQTSAPVVNLDELKYYHRPMHLFGDSINIFTGMIGVLIIMVPVRWIYLALEEATSVNPEVASGLFVLPLVVTTIIDIVQYSLPLAFALAGVFAGVRYRATFKSLADGYFTFAAIGVGLAGGTRALGIGLVLAIFFCYAMLLYPPVRSPTEKAPLTPTPEESKND